MKFYIWFAIAIVIMVMVVPVIMATAWKIASLMVAGIIAAIFLLIWKVKRHNRSHF